MSTQHSRPRPAPVPAPPRMALVRRLDVPAPSGLAPWARALLRLCLYAVPVLWGLLLQFMARIGDVHRIPLIAHAQFLLVFTFAWIAAIECFHAGGCEGINREHTGAMAVLKSVCAATGAAVLLLL